MKKQVKAKYRDLEVVTNVDQYSHLDDYGKGRFNMMKEIEAFLLKEAGRASRASKDPNIDTHKNAHLAGIKDSCSKAMSFIKGKFDKLKNIEFLRFRPFKPSLKDEHEEGREPFAVLSYNNIKIELDYTIFRLLKIDSQHDGMTKALHNFKNARELITKAMEDKIDDYESDRDQHRKELINYYHDQLTQQIEPLDLNTTDGIKQYQYWVEYYQNELFKSLNMTNINDKM